MAWFVVADPDADVEAKADPHARIWTLSQEPDQPGWNTDCGHEGYGMRRDDAEFLAECANAKEWERD
jgi:hypothetical protein